MKTHRLGSNGPELSVVGFGAWEAGGGSEWGQSPPEEQVVQAIRTVPDTGIDWIDTAEVYGDGRSEELVGRAIAGRRDELFIATKVAPSPEGSGFRPEEIAKAVRGSLQRLGIDHIDLYQLHWPDETGIPVEDSWGAMATLVDDGLVRFIGVSNFDRELIERCEPIRHVDSLQQEFSMLALDDRELIRWCGEQGTGVVTYGPLAYGLLTGKITMETAFDRDDHRSQDDRIFPPDKRERSLAVVDGMRPIAERLGISLAQLALAWNVHQPGVTSAIAGSRDPGHVRANAVAGDVELDADARSELERLVTQGPATA
ncbi:MAG TPA: aldo/keto reductase [Actinomycetota bacterium]|nr:aldo/keto reductase [Actinomycetota bacterium]